MGICADTKTHCAILVMILIYWPQGLSQSCRFRVSNQTAGSASLVRLLLSCSYAASLPDVVTIQRLSRLLASSPLSKLIGQVNQETPSHWQKNCQSKCTVRIAGGPDSQCYPKFSLRFVVKLS